MQFVDKEKQAAGGRYCRKKKPYNGYAATLLNSLIIKTFTKKRQQKKPASEQKATYHELHNMQSCKRINDCDRQLRLT